MKTKKVCSSELAYLLGLLTLAVGTALMEKANLGMSMVVAPAYILHLKISQILPFYTFGMSEYVFQAVLLVLMSLILRRFKISYLFSFATAVIYGMMLDLCMDGTALLSCCGFGMRILFYIAGMLICSLGVALLFHTYIAPEAYELFVKEITEKKQLPIDRVKTAYDCCSCLLGVILSFVFFGFGHFEGVKWGTVFCALVNGWIIGRISDGLENHLEFKDRFPFRSVFSK